MQDNCANLEVICANSQCKMNVQRSFLKKRNCARKSETDKYLYAWIPGAIIYIITTIWAMTLFVKNLLKLSQMNQLSMTNVNDAKKFTHQQTRLMNSASRYISLILLSLISSTISIAIASYGLIQYEAREIAVIACCIDSTVNIIMLYLQYSFSTKYYNKYCFCINSFGIKYL